jgi:hypothetical protein
MKPTNKYKRNLTYSKKNKKEMYKKKTYSECGRRRRRLNRDKRVSI